MADIKNEIQSLRDFVAPMMPTVAFKLQFMPTEFRAEDLIIQYKGGVSETETGYHYRHDRTYQFVYIGISELDCLTKAQPLERLFNNEMVIPLKGTTRYLRIESFSLSEPFKTESGVFAIIGMLEVNLREARGQITYPKVEHVGVTTPQLTIEIKK
ncbi:hypothetical protein [Peribacillus huizhouensis]|uniref:Uncharacterized protein n=1 Tax=Peribacillus huizhouensis TaxID=1501239 RepID=A0ABR6CRE0_9BACI|nr:hypothetical protein [Peribacillus huizhouensis]MBA9027519.1 hypothetical protein [Peribacillus huizhouensis]